jgi:hypothetical protein
MLQHEGVAASSQAPTVGAIFDQVGELAHLAQEEQDATLARVATDASTLADELHQLGKLLATIAGVPEPGS